MNLITSNRPIAFAGGILLLLSSAIPSHANDWDGIPVPADPGEGRVWELHPASDDFNYEAPAADKGEAFNQRWTDTYHNHWTGPGLTLWREDHSLVEDGHLRIIASRANTNQVYTGCITSRERVGYPVFVEARARICNSTLASDVWMLSPDDTQEIDIIEAYGTSYSQGTQSDQTYYAERLHISHHVFIRDPFQDYQPKDQGTWHHDGTLWRDDFHRVGVYWRDPWHLEYYVNGKLVRTVSGRDIIDPKNFTEGTGLNKEMDIIINMEDQAWRSNRGLTPTDEELANEEDHTFKVDWIRVYKPVPESE